MFSRYWRSYPWWMQLIQLIILISVLFSFFVFGIGYGLVPKMTGISLSEVATINAETPANVLQAAFSLQVLFSISVFLFSSLLFAYFTHPRPAEYLGLRKPRKPVQWVLVLFVMLGAIPIFLQIGSWMELIDFGPDVVAQQKQYEESVNAMLKMPDFASFLKVFTIMAVLPAIGEELFFRGIFMRFAAKRSRGVVFPILLSSIMFAMVHGNAYGMLSIFLAGALLAGIYYLTSSLYLSMLGHMLNNGLQVALLYFGANNATIKAIGESNELPAFVPIIAAVVFAASFYLLWKSRTPLPPDWADDYTKEELSEKAV